MYRAKRSPRAIAVVSGVGSLAGGVWLAAAQDHQHDDHREEREGVEGEPGLGADRCHEQSAEGRPDRPGDVERHRVE